MQPINLPIIRAFGALVVFDKLLGSRGEFADRSFGVIMSVSSLDKLPTRAFKSHPASLQAIAMVDDFMTLSRNGAKGVMHLSKGDTICGFTCITISCLHILCFVDRGVSVKTGIRLLSTHQYAVLRCVTYAVEYGVDVCDFFGTSIICEAAKGAGKGASGGMKKITSSNFFKQISTIVKNIKDRNNTKNE